MQVRPPDQSEPGDEPTNQVPAAPEIPTADFVTCYELHYRRLVRALELAGADRPMAEDVAQEAFARALARWWRVKRGPNPPGYVYTAGFRLLARAQRRLAVTRAGDDRSATGEAGSAGGRGVAPAGGADPTASAATSSVAVETVLSAMPPRRRACAVMCLVVGLPVGEAGETLGIAAGTVRKHLDEARKDLAAALGPSRD